MPYLLGQQRIRAYGSYNSKNNSFMLNTINNGSCWVPRQARCRGDCLPKQKKFDIRNKRINGTVRVSSSEYQMNKASGLSTQNVIFNTLQPKPVYDRDDLNLLQWNQSSDRAFPSRFNKMMKVNVPSHGNSTKTSLTRHRPGAGAGGKQLGVDLKHNSYHRYLLKKKGLKPLRGEKQKVVPWNNPKPHQSKAVFDKSVQNNKWRKDSIVANMNLCSKEDPEDCKTKPAPEPEVKPEDLLKYISVDENNYMELTSGKGTPGEPFTGKSNNLGINPSTAKISFKAEQDSTVTVYIKSGSEYDWDAAYLVLNDDFVSLNNINDTNGMGKGEIVTVSALENLRGVPLTGNTADEWLQPENIDYFVGFLQGGINVGQSGNDKETTINLPVLAGDKIKIYYVKDSSVSLFEDAIIEFSIYAEPSMSHKELPKLIVQEQEFFKTSLKEVEPKKAPEDFFNINKFDYTVKSKDTIERIKESTMDVIITDLNNVEELYESNPYITYMDSNKKEVKVLLKDLESGVKVNVSKPVSLKFRSKAANFDAEFKNGTWTCNPPISKQNKDIFIFDKLQKFTLVARIN